MNQESFCSDGFRKSEKNEIEYDTISKEDSCDNKNDQFSEISKVKQQIEELKAINNINYSLLKDMHEKQFDSDINDIKLQNDYNIVHPSREHAKTNVTKNLENLVEITNLNILEKYNDFETRLQTLEKFMDSLTLSLSEFETTMKENFHNMNALIIKISNEFTKINNVVNKIIKSNITKSLNNLVNSTCDIKIARSTEIRKMETETEHTEPKNDGGRVKKTIEKNDSKESSEKRVIHEEFTNVNDITDEQQNKNNLCINSSRDIEMISNNENLNKKQLNNSWTSSIVFKITKRYKYSGTMNFSEFINDWFFGCKQSDMIPIYEIKHKKRGWIKINGSTQYAKFRRLADVLKMAFGDDIKNSITKIDNIILTSCDISDDLVIKRSFCSVGKLASFLIGTNKGKVTWPKSIDRQNIILNLIKKSTEIIDRSMVE